MVFLSGPDRAVGAMRGADIASRCGYVEASVVQVIPASAGGGARQPQPAHHQGPGGRPRRRGRRLPPVREQREADPNVELVALFGREAGAKARRRIQEEKRLVRWRR